MDKYDCLKLENQLCFPLYVCAKEVVRQYKPFLDEIDLTYTQYITMMVMWEQKEISVKGLGDYLFLDSGTLTPVLKTLEKKGYVERTRSKEDERSLIVSLTKEGEALKEKAVTVPAKVAKCVSLSPEDAGELYRILHTIMDASKVSFDNK
ncbi:MAG: MarR family transcriptional regulator [Lachnospiraceae bacterium]|nr:MarR family transcriptional regulator [Lachnospiraceae bacterium]